MLSLRVVLGLCALLAASTACGPWALYNTQYSTPERASLYADKRSRIIEFDDDGYTRDARQVTAALDAMDTAAKDHRVLVLLFVHGWNNNARPDNSNLRRFDSLAIRVEGDLNRELAGTRPWQVVPIFIAWRGESSWRPAWYNLWLTWPWRQVTFFGRKAASERVGRGALAVVLATISGKWRGWREGDDRERRYNSLILLGHSFGAGALLSATLPLLTAQLAAANGPVGSPQVADLVVAINPAIQAAVLDMSALSPLTHYASDGRSLVQLMILDADKDHAREVLFPIGRTVGGLLRTSSHWTAQHIAAGRPESQRHFVLRPGDRSAPTDLSCRHFYPTNDQRSPDLQLLELARTDSTVGCTDSVIGIRTEGDVIDGHSGIWFPAMSDFLRQFVIEQNQERRRQLDARPAQTNDKVR